MGMFGSIGNIVSSALGIPNDGPIASVTGSTPTDMAIGATGASGSAGGSPNGLIPAALSYFGNMQTNAANADQAALNRQFQLDMSNTAYRRAEADMLAGGLNPILAYRGGASTAPGSTAVMTNSAGAAVDAYAKTATIKNQLANMQADTDLKASLTNQADTQANLNQSQDLTQQKQQQVMSSQINQIDAQTKLLQNSAVSSSQAAQFLGEHPTLQKIKTFFDSIGITPKDVYQSTVPPIINSR